jgi:hypothetical protein
MRNQCYGIILFSLVLIAVLLAQGGEVKINSLQPPGFELASCSWTLRCKP